MNDEQNTTENSSHAGGATSDQSPANDTTAPSQPVSDIDSTKNQDDYYAVDYRKKEVLSTIGDGEMHDEGLVESGDGNTDIRSSTERMTDEQDEAESHDSEQ